MDIIAGVKFGLEVCHDSTRIVARLLSICHAIGRTEYICIKLLEHISSRQAGNVPVA